MNMKKIAGHLGFTSLLVASGVVLAEPQLYETGPSEESSYVRFVNATDKPVSVVTAKAKIELPVKDAARSSRFFPVKAGTKLSATLQASGHKIAVDVTGKPWEYITVIAMSDGTYKAVRETPDDFNASRSSVALFNIDAACAGATMLGGAKNATVLDGVKPYTVQRRLINPVKLQVSLGCGGPGVSVDLSQLQAGERYSVFMLPQKNAVQTFFVQDSN